MRRWATVDECNKAMAKKHKAKKSKRKTSSKISSSAAGQSSVINDKYRKSNSLRIDCTDFDRLTIPPDEYRKLLEESLKEQKHMIDASIARHMKHIKKQRRSQLLGTVVRELAAGAAAPPSQRDHQPLAAVKQ